MTIIQELKKKIEEKNRVLKSAKKLFDARDDIIDLFFIFQYLLFWQKNYIRQKIIRKTMS